MLYPAELRGHMENFKIGPTTREAYLEADCCGLTRLCMDCQTAPTLGGYVSPTRLGVFSCRV